VYVRALPSGDQETGARMSDEIVTKVFVNRGGER
jgi:hypothetical protein